MTSDTPPILGNPIVSGSARDDGLYQYTAMINDIDADVKDREAFAKAAAKQARQVIAAVLAEELTAIHVQTNPKSGIYKIILKDPTFMEL